MFTLVGVSNLHRAWNVDRISMHDAGSSVGSTRFVLDLKPSKTHSLSTFKNVFLKILYICNVLSIL